MELFLHGLKKLDALRLRRVVIDAGGVYIGDFLVETSLRGADILNPSQQLFKIVKGLVRIFQPFVIQNKSFNDKLAQFLCGPDAEPRGNGAFYTAADGMRFPHSGARCDSS